jgi:hypothetical protein
VSASSSCVVYDKPNETGACRLFWVPTGARYLALSSLDLYKEMGLLSTNASLHVYPAVDGSGGTAAVMFGTFITAYDIYIGGPFTLVSRVSDLGSVNVKDVNPELDSICYGLLLVNMSRPGHLQFGQSAQALVNTVWPSVSQQFTAVDPGLSVHKGPKAAWMWRKDLADRPLIKVNVVFNYDPNGFPGAFLFDDYKISVDFYFDFWVEDSGLGAQAVYYEGTISAGKLTKLVKSIAKLAVQLAMWELNEVQLPKALTSINQNLASKGITVSDVFLLPGKQVSSGVVFLGNTERAGDTKDDATLVLESPVG